MDGQILPRFVARSVERLLRSMPVVVLMGARQTGKSTLARELLPGRRLYLTLDDLDVREQAARSPNDLLERGQKLVLDEVQRVPDLLLAVKRAVDSSRRPGRFVLTGSANLLLMQRVSESLAGRAAYVTLWPLTRAEASGLGRAGVWGELFEHDEADWPALFASREQPSDDWRALARRGGFPVAVLASPSAEDRAIWFDGYVRTYLERDLQDLTSIDNLIDFRRLMLATCLRLGQLVNQTELGRDVQLPQPTVRRWLNLLETSYQLVRLPAYSVNRTKRLIKTSKAYWSDTGLALHLTRTSPTGAHLENLILADLMAWKDGEILDRPELFYWRTAAGEEVDLLIERGGALIAIEVKATTRPGFRDTAGLRSFRDEYGDAVRGTLLVHAGERVERLAPGIVSVPWWRLI